MKKFITLLLVLTGMVCMASAADKKTATVYVKASKQIYIHVWNTTTGGEGEDDATTSAFDNALQMSTTTQYGISFYKYDIVYYSSSFSFLVKDVQGSINYGDNQSADKEGVTGGFYTWDGSWKTAVNDYNSSISSIQLTGGSLDKTLTYDDGSGKYTGSIDLSSTMMDKTFKIRVTLGSNDQINFGWNDYSLSLTDAGSLLSAESGDGSNFVLNNTQYKTYDVSMSFAFTNATGSAFTFAGNTARGSKTYNVTVTNNAGWSNVKIYTFSPDTDKQTGTWEASDDMATSDGGDTWTYSKTFYEPYPEKVIFKNDNSGTYQTRDLNLINNHTYSNQSVEKYYVVGNIPEFGNFDHTNNTALMTFVENGDQDYHEYTVDDVELSGNIEYKIAKKFYDEQSVIPSSDWYPASNKEITISETGKYSLYVRFNDYWGDKTLATVTSCTATLTAVPATISTVGQATFSSTHDLDFTGITTLTAYRAASASGGNVNMKKLTGKVPANTGLYITGETTYIPVTTGAGSIGDNLLHPTTGGDIYDSGKYRYVFARQGDDIGFYKVGSSLSPAAGKAYLETGSTLSRYAISFDDDETTGIVAVEKTDNTDNVENKVVYNLNGQRVMNPSKGLYIVNGKKVIIK